MRVATICLGQACSAGSFLLAAGTRGKRYALTNARVMVHQPAGVHKVKHLILKSRLVTEILKIRERLNKIYGTNRSRFENN